MNDHIVKIVMDGKILGFPKPIKDRYVVSLIGEIAESIK